MLPCLVCAMMRSQAARGLMTPAELSQGFSLVALAYVKRYGFEALHTALCLPHRGALDRIEPTSLDFGGMQ